MLGVEFLWDKLEPNVGAVSVLGFLLCFPRLLTFWLLESSLRMTSDNLWSTVKSLIVFLHNSLHCQMLYKLELLIWKEDPRRPLWRSSVPPWKKAGIRLRDQ